MAYHDFVPPLVRALLVAGVSASFAFACTGTVKVGGREGVDSGAPAGVVTAEEEAACARYKQALCAKAAECGWGYEDCEGLARWECPDDLFADGTSRTPEGVASCAAEYAAWPCEKLERDERPPCVTPGKRPPRAPCTYDNQCASHVCGTDFLQCGRCSARAEPFGPCDETSYCPVPQLCIDGRCRTRESPVIPVGGDCSEGRCEDGAICRARAGEPYTCVRVPRLGDPCGSDVSCDAGLICVEGRCEALPGLGEPCVILPGATTGLCGREGRCLDRTCVTRGEPGDPCEPKARDHQCGNGLCECDRGDCTRYVCHAVRFAGESCAEPFVACGETTTCVDGACVSGRLGTPHRDECLAAP